MSNFAPRRNISHSKKYKNVPTVLGWKFKGKGRVSIGNLRETEISIFPFGNESVFLKFPQQKMW